MSDEEFRADVERVIHEYERIAGHPAVRTWQMLRRYGYEGTLSRLVVGADLQKGFRSLVEAGHFDLTFEAVVIKYSSRFKKSVVEAAEWRLKRVRDGDVA